MWGGGLCGCVGGGVWGVYVCGVCVCVCVCIVYSITQSCPTLCNPLDCSLPWSSVCGIFQARVLERVAISSFRVSS